MNWQKRLFGAGRAGVDSEPRDTEPGDTRFIVWYLAYLPQQMKSIPKRKSRKQRQDKRNFFIFQTS